MTTFIFPIVGDVFDNPNHLNVVNCIFANSCVYLQGYLQASHNGFYNSGYLTEYYDNHDWGHYKGYDFGNDASTSTSTFGSPATTTGSSPFQTAAAANYYLADNTFRGLGMSVLDEIKTMTTYAPQDGGWPDSTGTDLGYHYPMNEDSDYDGLPDWWEYCWFGDYTHTGGELDANGNTLLSDYQSGADPYDPNVIAFTIEATNDYVNTATVGVQLAITAGTPAYYAVLINGQTTKNWLPFVSTNLTVSLGATDGVYDVNVGLRGYATNATQAWSDYRFTLDRVVPVTAITYPVLSGGAATVTKPYLQVQGLANEQLSSLTYDINNALGVVTNLDGFVTDQVFDTNRFDFTTNYFQCYDVPLATNGPNIITVHATDWRATPQP